MNMYKGISKHSWKKIVRLIWTVATYSRKEMLNLDLNIILIVLKEFAYIKTFPELYSRFDKYYAI